MPKLVIKTVESKAGWTNPNNPDMVSYDVTIEANGRKAQARTFSKAISEVGFEGEVETYEKKDHTYLKQVQSEEYANKSYSNNRRSFGGGKDNSDGQRQGMCINNANAYVVANNKNLSAKEWAQLTHSYAQALYSLGDLTKEEAPVEDTASAFDTSDIEDIFNS